MRVSLWFIRETDLARLYCKLPPSRNPSKEDELWLPNAGLKSHFLPK